jgi:RNA polymerase sigma factor (sigma-70 family)
VPSFVFTPVETGNPTLALVQDDQDRRIAETLEREGSRLRSFIRRRIADRSEVEDVLQDVFFELTAAYRLAEPIDQVGAWLFRVARNRITDLFRKKRPEPLPASRGAGEDDAAGIEDLLPSPDAGPEALYARKVLLEELAEALDDLPAEQREVFVAHEIEGRTFRELAAETGLSINTLLSRKRYATLHLRRKLQAIYADFKKG